MAGNIRSSDGQKADLLQNASSSVLACLQLPITVKRIQKRVETQFCNAVRRVAGLRLISAVIGLNLDPGASVDLLNWFCAGLRNGENQMSHFLTSLNGCGNHLER